MTQEKRGGSIPLISLPSGYIPSPREEYMNALQLEYFRQKLESWKTDLLKGSVYTLSHMKEETRNESDIADRASTETDRALELMTRERDRKLLHKITEALKRIQEGSYGFCEETGEPIGLARLEARPVATLSVEAQERRERSERFHHEE